MSRPRTKREMERAARRFAAASAALWLGGMLAGCSDAYLDRRETVDLSGGDAMAANMMTQEVDPWPRNSGNKTIPYNGQKMQVAVERYRTGTVIPPVSAVTSDAAAPPSVPPLPPSESQNAAGGAPAAAVSTATQ